MIDLHIHTNYSGGESNLIEILKIAEKRNVSTIAITDNNTCEAYKELKQIAVKEYFSGKIIPGCEFSTIVNNVPIELIGYNINIIIENYMFKNKIEYDIIQEKNRIVNLLENNIVF